MGLKLLKCPKCGQSNLIKEDNNYRCPMCESIIFNDDYKTYEETIERLIQEGKEADIGVLRYSLNEELKQTHLNTGNIKNICRQIRAILPEDIIASFYLIYVERKSYPRNYESYLKTLIQEKVNNYEINQIIPVIINSCDIRVKELIEELLKAHNLYNQENIEKINKALKEREQEIELYDTEKDVFVCHSSKDNKEIVKIVEVLEDNNISCWYSERNLPWDIENYWEGIHKAIKDCKVFLFVLSKYSRVSKDVIHELDYARNINKEIRVEYRIDDSENNIPIKKCFDGIQWIDGSCLCKHEELAEKIYCDLEDKIQNDNKVDTQVVERTNETKLNYSKIEFHLNFEEYSDAIKEIKELMMKEPYDAKLWELLLEAELEGKQESNAKIIKTFNKLLSLVDIERKQELEKKYSFLVVDINKSKDELIGQSKEDPNTIYLKGKEYEELEDFDNAAKFYRQAAEQGHAEAQYLLSWCYYQGEGVKEDVKEAFKWRKLAAQQGHAEAQYHVGWGYYYGEGIEKNYEEYIKWTKLAAKQNYIKAQIALGDSYYHGYGVTIDYHEAVKWYQVAANQGSAEAQKMLGSCYYFGYGVAKDHQEAFKWYKKSADQGYAEAQASLGNCYYYGYGVNKDYQESVKLYRLAAEQGNKVAQNNLGVCYKNGIGVEKDYKETIKWYKKSAEQGYALAQKNLGNAYYFGEIVGLDFQEAAKWYRLAADQGDKYAQLRLGECHYYGYGVAKDYLQAVKWYELAAQQGMVTSRSNLAYCYYKGLGVRQDYKEAVKWYRLAAEQEDEIAQCSLGICYYEGQGVPLDYGEAAKWFEKAAKKNNANALFMLGNCYYLGRGKKLDFTNAYLSYLSAAQQGHERAQNNLAKCLEEGKGVTKNIPEAIKWYKKAAQQGNENAKRVLRVAYKIEV